MVKTDFKFLVGSAITGVVSAVFLITSLSTEYWVTAEVTTTSNTAAKGSVNHGLFTGRYDRLNIGAKKTYYLTAECLISEGVCIWSCLSDDGARFEEIFDLFYTGVANFQCEAVAESYAREAGVKVDPDAFLQAGLLYSTIAFLAAALLCNVVAVGFNIYNIFYNPIYAFAGITGLYVYYGYSVGATILAIVLWGAEFGAYTTNNIAILDTLMSKQLDVTPTLGFSYYFLIIALIEQCVSICLIYYRQYRINKAQEETMVRVDDKTNDASTFMF